MYCGNLYRIFSYKKQTKKKQLRNGNIAKKRASLSPAVGVELFGETASTGGFSTAWAGARVDRRNGWAVIAFEASPVVTVRGLTLDSAADRQLRVASQYGTNQVFITIRSEVDPVLSTDLL